MMEASEDSSVSDQADSQYLQKVTETTGQIHTNSEQSNNMNEVVNPVVDPEIEGEENMECNEDEELGEKKSKTAGGFTGRGVTLQMLLEDNILQPKEGAMSLEYMGQKFNGDLLADGKIFSAEVQEVFSSPSAWALRCKKIVNPEQKYGCGWSSVRYCGRPLDVYKNQWMKKRRLEQVSDNLTIDDCNISTHEPIPVEPELENDSVIKSIASDRQIVKHETLGNRTSIEDSNLLIETISFATVGKLQPFLISLHTAALVVMDVHCSLTRSEVVGYLAGSWDMNTNTLTIKQAFPYLSRLADSRSGQATEIKIAQSMENSGFSLVGWYHSHPMVPPTPTVQDIDTQLEYQLKLKGTGELGYRPCVAMISSPFHHMDSSESNSPSHLMCYWVSPPTESRPLELGRPMAMQYNVVYDASIRDEVVPKLEACLKFYQDAPDRTNFDENWSEELTAFEKLKSTVKSSLQSEEDLVVIELIDILHSEKIKKHSPSPLEATLETEQFSPNEKNSQVEITCS